MTEAAPYGRGRRVCSVAMAVGFVSLLVAGCGGREHASPYAAAVYDDPPLYCYRTIGDVDCYRRPLAGAERRLVNFYGPAPDDYEPPEPAPAPVLHPPPPPRPAPVPGEPSAAVPAPPPEAAAAPADHAPTSLLPARPSSAAKAPGGDGPTAAEITSDPSTDGTAAGETASAEAGNTALASPKSRPAAMPAAPPPAASAPLVIEVEAR